MVLNGNGEICTVIRTAVEGALEKAVRISILFVVGGARGFREQDKEILQPGKVGGL